MSQYVVTSRIELERLIGYNKLDANLNFLDVSRIEDFSKLFQGSFFHGDISEWDVSGAKDMSFMFHSSVFTGDISKWDTANVTNMYRMFGWSTDLGNSPQMTFFGSDVFITHDAMFHGDISKWRIHKDNKHGNSIKERIAMLREIRGGKTKPWRPYRLPVFTI